MAAHFDAFYTSAKKFSSRAGEPGVVPCFPRTKIEADIEVCMDSNTMDIILKEETCERLLSLERTFRSIELSIAADAREELSKLYALVEKCRQDVDSKPQKISNLVMTA